MADARPGIVDDEASGAGIPAADLRDLVIGLGNPWRGDDGAGAWLAERALTLRPAPRVRIVQQLTPELSAELAQARRVLFVDAWVVPSPTTEAAPAEPCLMPQPVATPESGDADDATGAFSHLLRPAPLLAITALLYGRAPAAWQLLMPAFCLGHGRGLSAELRRLLPQGQMLLRQWCEGRETQSPRPASPNPESGPRHA